MNDPIPAITLWQPWASLIAAGFKPYQFRAYPAPRRHIGKRIAIHAGARPIRWGEIDQLIRQLAGSIPGRQATGLIRHDEAKAFLRTCYGQADLLPLGSVVCTAVLGEPIRDAELTEKLGLVGTLNDWDHEEHSNWGWPLTDVQLVQPMAPAKGKQGWWTWRAPE